MIVRVHVPLASSFASFCPAMSLAGVRARHDWVEARTMRIIGYDPILSEQKWKRSGLSLGQAVHEVVKHLQLNPPEILEITDAGLQAIQPTNSRFRTNDSSQSTTSTNDSATRREGTGPPSYDASLQHAKRVPQLPPPPEVPFPPIPRDFDAILADKTKEELEALLSDELEFLSLVHNLDIFVEIHKIARSKTDETHHLANENLSNQDKVKSLCEEVERLQKILKAKVEHFQALEQKQNSLCAPPDMKSIIRKLKEASKVAFDTSEAFAEEWVDDGAPNVDQFMNEFVQRRKLHHERAGKMQILMNPQTTKR